MWAVEAVGMGANSRLFLTPCLRTHRSTGAESAMSSTNIMYDVRDINNKKDIQENLLGNFFL